MKAKRKRHSAAFKAKVGFEALVGLKTVSQLARVCGASDAGDAVAQATAAGAPQNFFCYFACDFDAQLSDQTAINAYMDGAASVLGGVNRVGFYGGYSQVRRVLDAGKAAKGWQTTAWSGGNKDSRISLYQYAYGATIPGDAVNTFDKDEGYGNDLGQWSVASPTSVIIVSINPISGSVVAGNTFTISASVNSSQSQPVLLGASLVPAGTTSSYISDPPHDAIVTLGSGNNSVSRQFTVPAGTTAGSYDLLFAVWQDSNGNGQIGSGDTLLAWPMTIPSALTVTTQPNPPSAPTTTAATGLTSSGFIANWNGVNGAAGYRLDISTSSFFGSYLSGYQDLDIGNTLSRNVSGLNANTTFYYRVRAYNAGGTSVNSGAITVATLGSAVSPTITNPRLNGTSFSLSVSTQIGFNYTLEFKNLLRDANWTAIQTTNGTGGTIDLIDNSAAGSTRFYRVRVQ